MIFCLIWYNEQVVTHLSNLFVWCVLLSYSAIFQLYSEIYLFGVFYCHIQQYFSYIVKGHISHPDSINILKCHPSLNLLATRGLFIAKPS